MTTLKALLDELEMRAGKATPGNWSADETPLGDDIGVIVADSAKQTYDWQFVCQVGLDPSDENDVPRKQAEANLAYISACRPKNILRLTRALRGMMEENARMREALKSLVEAPLRYNGNCIEIDCMSHGGAMERVRKARAALEQESKDE